MKPFTRSQNTMSSRSGLLLLLLLWLSVGCKADPLPRQRIQVPPSPQALQRGGRVPLAAKQTNPQAQRSQRSQRGNQVAGLSWSLPSRWKLGPRRRMRVATYLIPAKSNPRAPGGECSVFYFGKRQGGSIIANLSRWKRQFRPAQGQQKLAMEKIKQFKIKGLSVATIELKGTFLFSPRPMSPSKIPRPNHHMLGAIVNAPQGLVFFKCVGPMSVMLPAQHEFQALLQSFRTKKY